MGSTQKTQILTPANVVTIVRIVGVPIFVVVMLAPWECLFPDASAAAALKPWVSALVFLVLSFSDFLDGYLARSRNEVTNFGKFMDPLADKLLVIAAFLGMTQNGLLPAWVPLIVLFREFLVSGLRMMAASEGLVIAASWYGKAKTVTQMIAIVLFILINAIPQTFGAKLAAPIYYLAWIALIVSLVLTILSMIDYFAKSKSVFLESEPCKPTLSPDAVDIPSVDDASLYSLAEATLACARAKHLTIGTAESLTCGMISSSLASVPGSSDTLAGGVSSYSYAVKSAILGVEAKKLEAEGAVNSWTAQQMAEGAHRALGCSITVAVTGIAGPGGEEPGKPVGTVWTAVSCKHGTFTRKFCFTGCRQEVRMKTTAAALLLLQEYIETL